MQLNKIVSRYFANMLVERPDIIYVYRNICKGITRIGIGT